MGNVHVVCGGIDDRQADYDYEADASRHVYPDIGEDTCEVRFCGLVPSALSRFPPTNSLRPALRVLKRTAKGPAPAWKLRMGNTGVFEDDFALQELIDVGSFGQVYVVVEHTSQQRSAVKVFKIDPTKPKPPRLGTEEDLDDNLVAAIAREELLEGEDLDPTLSSVLDKAVEEDEREGGRSRSATEDTKSLSDAGTPAISSSNSLASMAEVVEEPQAGAAGDAVEESKGEDAALLDAPPDERKASPKHSASPDSERATPAAPSPVVAAAPGDEPAAPTEATAAGGPSEGESAPSHEVAQREGQKDHEASIERLEDVYHEIGLLQQLEHVNIVRYMDFYESDDRVYLITELVEGGKLFDSICQRGKYAEADARQVITGVLHALEYLHDLRIIYRDLKPENVLLVGESHPNEIKLCDFGFATQLRDSNYATGKWYTPGFGAPELLSGMPYDFKVDVYSLGVLSFVLLTGCIPWDEEIWSDEAKIDEAMIAGKANFHPEDWENVSKSGFDFVSWAMTTEPAQRASVKELLNHPFITQRRYGPMQRAVHNSRALLCEDHRARPLFSSRKSVRPPP